MRIEFVVSWIYENPLGLDKYREAFVEYFESEEEVEEFIKIGDQERM